MNPTPNKMNPTPNKFLQEIHTRITFQTVEIDEDTNIDLVGSCNIVLLNASGETVAEFQVLGVSGFQVENQ
jgi:hypothetical protein